MGLDVSHDAWGGAYSAFNRWRTALAEAAGGGMEAILSTGLAHYTYQPETFDTSDQEAGFNAIMEHSDCDGEISAETCEHVADALELLLPNISEERAGGHIDRTGGMIAATKRFIEGCREAHRLGEPLEFH